MSRLMASLPAGVSHAFHTAGIEITGLILPAPGRLGRPTQINMPDVACGIKHQCHWSVVKICSCIVAEGGLFQAVRPAALQGGLSASMAA
jgi:hypothetical protein